jgi:NADPH-dependent stearoyl-CoA 9-desaturase
LRQILLAERTIHKLALPDRFLVATSDDAPETASERKFLFGDGLPAVGRGHGTLSGLRTALREKRERASARRTSLLARLIHKSGRRRPTRANTPT